MEELRSQLEEPHAGACEGQGPRAGPRALTWASGSLLSREGVGARPEVPSPEAFPLPSAQLLPPSCSPLFPTAPPTQPAASPAPHLPGPSAAPDTPPSVDSPSGVTSAPCPGQLPRAPPLSLH